MGNEPIISALETLAAISTLDALAGIIPYMGAGLFFFTLHRRALYYAWSKLLMQSEKDIEKASVGSD